MAKMKWFDWILISLVIIGAINWGLVGFDFNLVTFLLGKWQMAVKVVYWAVGLSGIISMIRLIVNN